MWDLLLRQMKGLWADALEDAEAQSWLPKVCLKTEQPAQPDLAVPRLYLGKGCPAHCLERLCGSCCLVRYFHNQQCINNYIYLAAVPPRGLQPWLPTPAHLSPAFCAAVGDGAGSPALSPAQMTCSHPRVNCPRGSHLRGAPCGLCGARATPPRWQGPCWRGLPETPGSAGSQKLVLNTAWSNVGII